MDAENPIPVAGVEPAPIAAKAPVHSPLRFRMVAGQLRAAEPPHCAQHLAIEFIQPGFSRGQDGPAGHVEDDPAVAERGIFEGAVCNVSGKLTASGAA
jgi:hypothetical protein